MMKTKKLNKVCLQILIYFITLFLSLFIFSLPVIKLYNQFVIQPFMTGHTTYNYLNSRIRLLTAQVLPSEIRFYNSLDNYFSQAKEIFILPSYIENAFSCCVGITCNNSKNKTSCKLERVEDRLGNFKNAFTYKMFSEDLNLTGASDIFISINGLANSNKNIKFKYYSFIDTCCIDENCKDYFSTNKSYKTPCKVKEVQEVLNHKLNSDSIYQIIFSQADLESRSKLSGLKDISKKTLKVW